MSPTPISTMLPPSLLLSFFFFLLPFFTLASTTIMSLNKNSYPDRLLASGDEFWQHQDVVAPASFSVVFVSVSFSSGENQLADCDSACLISKIDDVQDQYHISSWGRQELSYSGFIYSISLGPMSSYEGNDYCGITSNASPLMVLMSDVKTNLNVMNGVNPNDYNDILVIFLPTAFGEFECVWDGIALVKGEAQQWSSSSSSYNPVWIRKYTDAPVVGHEIGHVMGLAHAGEDDNNDGDCDGSFLACEYGDYTSMMGNPSVLRSTSFPQRVMLGLLNMESGDDLLAHEVILPTNTTETYEIVNLNTPSLDNVNSAQYIGLYLERFNEDHEFDGAYSISFMASDGWMSSEYPFLGDFVMIHYVKKNDNGESPLTPEFNTIKVIDGGGEGFVFQDGDWVVEVTNISDGVATVNISFACETCERDTDTDNYIASFDFGEWFTDNRTILIPSLALLGGVLLTVCAFAMCRSRRNDNRFATRRSASGSSNMKRQRRGQSTASSSAPASYPEAQAAENNHGSMFERHAEPSAPPFNEI